MTLFSTKHVAAYETKQRALDGRRGNRGNERPFRRELVDALKAEGQEAYLKRSRAEYRQRLDGLHAELTAAGVTYEKLDPELVAEVKKAWHL